MLAIALASILSTTTPAEGSARTPAPPSDADSVVAAAFKQDVGTKAPELKGETGFSWQNLIAPTLGLMGLAALAFAATKRKGLGGSQIRVVEAASLGEKRSLVIADVMGERLVLGVSEAGVTVLMNRPAPAGEPAPLRVPDAPKAMSLFERIKGGTPKSFDAQLDESIEDQELRAKLAAGQRGVVP